MNYKKNIGEHTVSATVFHRNRKDKIERLRVPYEAGVTLDSMANVGHDYSTGIELSGQVQLTRWWNMNLNGSLYHYKVKNRYKTGSEKRQVRTTMSCGTTLSMSLNIPVSRWTAILSVRPLQPKGVRMLSGM